jgi:transcriptional regulator with XRE-family HTH domain
MPSAVVKILRDLRENGALQGKDIANIANVSPATVTRWSQGASSPNLRTQTIFAELRYVIDRLTEFYTPDETRLWLHARHNLLGGQRAIDLINEGKAEDVLAIIERLDAGAYL